MEYFTERIKDPQQLWVESGNFFQHQWGKVLDFAGHDEYKLWFYGTAIVTTSVFWVFGGIYLLMDIYNKPKFMRKYKIQPGPEGPVDKERLKSAFKVLLINQLGVGLIFARLLYEAMKFRGYQPSNVLPAVLRIVIDIVVAIILQEITFYYPHRLLHWNKIYKYIHKKHHEWTPPIAIMAVYCHPIEHFFINLFPITFGMVFCGSHVVTAWIWFTIATLVTLHDHSGYHLPFLPSPVAHDFHHSKLNSNFGFLGILDWLHGTDHMFRKSKSGIGHKILFTFQSRQS